MFNLFEMLASSQDGKGFDALARQFSLTTEQTQVAVEALLPAFSQGLKRNTADPLGLTNFLSALSTGQHARFFDTAADATSPEGVAEGNGILGHLFGSKDLSRAVAAQAAQATGLSQQVLQQMLPAIASMIMGGLFKQSAGQTQGATSPLQAIFEQMMNQGGLASPQQAQQGDPLDNPFGRMLKGMLGASDAAPPPSRDSSGDTFGDNPLGKIFGEMLRGAQARDQREHAEPRQQDDGRSANPYDDLFGDMFEAGAKQRDDYHKSVESIFEQFRQGMEKR